MPIPWAEYDEAGRVMAKESHELGRRFVIPEFSGTKRDREFAEENYHAALDLMALAAEVLNHASYRSNMVIATRKMVTPEQREKMKRVTRLYQSTYQEAMKIIEGKA